MLWAVPCCCVLVEYSWLANSSASREEYTLFTLSPEQPLCLSLPVTWARPCWVTVTPVTTITAISPARWKLPALSNEGLLFTTIHTYYECQSVGRICWLSFCWWVSVSQPAFSHRHELPSLLPQPLKTLSHLRLVLLVSYYVRHRQTISEFTQSWSVS